ncbi:hypothetical protein IJ843_03540 [bacterium]|nr:hypothetical protein [bacterium]
MGMSASQARLLSITSRINDIELKSQQVSNIKMRLAAESEQVATDYTNALNKQKFTYTTYSKEGSEGQAVKVSLNSSTLSQSGLRLMRRNGSSFRTVQATTSSQIQQLINLGNRVTVQYREVAAHANESSVAASSVRRSPALTVQTAATSAVQTPVVSTVQTPVVSAAQTPVVSTVQNTASTIQANSSIITRQVDNSASLGMIESIFSSTDYEVTQVLVSGSDVPTTFSESELYEMIQSGEFYLADSTGKEISVSGNVQLAIESDTTGLAKAEAEYNAKTLKINNKEKKLDMELKSLDTEHNALSTEYDSVKQLIGDNIDKSFNIFS